MQKIFTNGVILNIMKLMNSEKSENLFNKKIPIKISFALQSNINAMQSAYSTYEATLQKLGEVYDVDFTKEQIKTKDPANQELFFHELNDLIKEQVSLDIKTINYSDLEKCDTASYDSLTSNDLGLIFWMIEDNKEET